MANLRLIPAAGGGAVEIDKDKTLVGRDPGCEIVISDGSVSRKHALLDRRTVGWFVIDQGSANGTFLDSQRVAESELHNGQELRFGAIAYKVEIEGEDSATTILTTGPEATVVAPTPLAPPKPAAPAPPAAPPRPAPPAAAPPPVPRPAPPAAPPPIPRPSAPAGAPPPIPTRPAAPAVPPPPTPRPAAPPPRPAAPPPRPAAPARAAGPPPPPAPAPGDAAPPAKKGRGPLFWTLTGCCGCLLLLLIGIGLIGGAAYFMTGDAVAAARGQLQELKRGDMDAAYARLSGSAQAQLPRPAFEAFVSRHPGLRENADSTFWSRSVKNDTATLSGLLTSASGTRERVTYELVKEGGTWKISGIDVEGDSGGGGGSSGGGGSGGGSSGAGRGGLILETTGVDKAAVSGGTAVTIKTQVSGFQVRPQGNAYAMDLVEDVDTVGPTGEAVPGLQQKEVERLRSTTSMDQGAIANFTTKLTLSDGTAAGRYTVRLTIRDQVGGTAKTHEVAFELP